jgi:hypothetical protein
MAKDPQQKIYAPARVCIYCGAKRYSINRVKLGEEHIVPFCINGSHILPLASCMKCESITGFLEQQLFGQHGHFRAARSALSTKSRSARPAKVFQTIPLFLTESESCQKVRINVPRDYAPHFIFDIEVDALPGLLIDQSEDVFPEGRIKLKIRQLNSSAKFPIGVPIGPPGIKLANFFRLPAKIAHSFATAELGVGAFRPLLLDYIKDRHAKDVPWRLVGGARGEGPSDKDYEISWREQTVQGVKHVVVEMRLLARLNFPKFIVVVGIIKSGADHVGES